MRAIIPAAGIGTRLRPHTHTLPKVLMNVAGKPILGHITDSLVESGVDGLTVIIGYQGEKVREYLNAEYSIPIDYVIQEQRKGLGHAVGMGLEESDSPALIILGDTIFDADFTDILNANETTIAVTEVEDPRRFGVVEMENGRVKRLVEKPDDPPSNLAIVGLYKINSQKQLKAAINETVEKDITTKGEYQLTDALQLMIEDGVNISVSRIKGWYDCGKKGTLLATNRYLLENMGKTYEIEGSTIIPPVYIGDDCTITHSVIGPHTTIDHNSVVENSVIQDSIVGANSTLSNCNLSHSLIGEETVVQGQLQQLNLGDHSEIEIS